MSRPRWIIVVDAIAILLALTGIASGIVFELRDDEAGVIPLSLIFVSLTALILVFRGRLAKRREHSQRVLSLRPGRVIACTLGIVAAAIICVLVGMGSRYEIVLMILLVQAV